MSSRIFTLSLLVIFTILAFTSIVSAQEDIPPRPSDDQVNSIAKQMYCPVCENIPLDVCPTQACIEWRELIRDKLSEGWNDQQIKEYFVEQYGDRVLAEPPARGINWLVYIVPPLAFLAGLYILFRAFKSWRDTKPPEKMEEMTKDINDEYIKRIEEDLQQL